MSQTRAPWRRHDWVWLRADFDAAGVGIGDAAGDAAAAAAAADPADACAARARAGLPFVVARQHAVGPTQVRLGFTPPGTGPRRRIGVVVPRAAVARIAAPPRLRDAIDAAPAAWQATMRTLAEACEALGLTARLYGSLAQQLALGTACLNPRSDLDVLVDLACDEALRALLRALRAADAGPVRVDGEIRSRGGWAVAWRELADALEGGRPWCLAKSDREVRLLPVGAPHDEFHLAEADRAAGPRRAA